MINTHITGDFCLTHKESLLQWPLIEPDDSYDYLSIDDLQMRWLNAIEITMNNLNSADEAAFHSYSETAFRNEILVESCLRVINHTNAHLRNIWCQIGLIGNTSKWPEQGIWMPKELVYTAIKNELNNELPKLNNSQSAFVRKLAKKYYKDIMYHNKLAIMQFCEDLMSTKDIWLQMIACDWINRSLALFNENDFFNFDRWLKNYITCWGSCDDFCKRVINPFLESYDGLYEVIVSWTKSENIWVRRASLVSFIKSSNSRYVATYSFERIGEVVNLLIKDKEKYVQKAVGWLLKAASIANQDKVIEFLKCHNKEMSRLSFTYAIENLPEDIQKELREIN